MARRPAKRNPERRRNVFGMAADALLASPVATGGGLVMTAMAAAIVTNALTLQPGSHPAPLFRDTRPVAFDPMATSALPMPLNRPATLRSNAIDPGLVAAIQTELKALGLYQGEVDGLPGPMTSAAILRFEEAAGLLTIGNPTGDVLAALVAHRSDRRSSAEPQRPTSVAEVPRPRPAPPRPTEVAREPAADTSPQPTNGPAAPEPAPIVAERRTAGDPIEAILTGGGPRTVAAEGRLAAEPAVQRVATTTREMPPRSVHAPPPQVADPRLARIQDALDLLGFGPLRADGLWTDETRQAIRRFEENRKLPVTGRLNEQFLAELIKIGGLSLN